MHHTFPRLGRASMLLAALLIGASCGGSDPAGPPAGVGGDTAIPPAEPVATELGFSAQPGDSRLDTVYWDFSETVEYLCATVSVSVEILDAFGRRITSASDGIHLHLAGPSYVPAGGWARAVAGVAFFDVAVCEAGSGFYFVARADGLAEATSSAFTISE